MSNEGKGQPKAPLPTTSARGDGRGHGGRLRGSPKQLELRLLINSHCPIITVESSEEDRFATLLRCAAADIGVPLYLWSVTEGLSRAGGIRLSNEVKGGSSSVKTLIGIPTLQESSLDTGSVP